ncbi:hypothetical protein [Sphingomonas desiccabilis]|uniref:hypothetical protein n=1 Tax=Sphingomonas desiccabilis TaxID=429134 RepID=UPI0017D89A30|nr:hypothetical protein [Sphingomonas desiccabilis]MBB3910007.1 hypothetical protein [Sphingomonas desiccabilis]
MKKLVAVASSCAALMMAAAPAVAANRAPAVSAQAPTLGVRAAAVNRTVVPTNAEASNLAGGGILIGVLALVAVGLGIYVAVDEDDDAPASV